MNRAKESDMSYITGFSKEVKEKLNHYVYRLVDPRNGQTFYVGEGCGDRVFAHANAVSDDFYTSEYATEQDKKSEDNKDPAKIKRIIDIKNSGLSVIHIIQRWGMDAKTAFEVEAAFIDYFGLQALTNLVKGHNSDRGMMPADQIEKSFNAPVFEDYPNSPKFILIKIKDYWLNYNDGDIYKTVRGNWKLSARRANNYPYVLAVRYGIVVGVYRINKNGWKKAPESERICFDGVEAEDEIKQLFIGKKIPERYKRRQNPAGYCD